MVISPFPHGTPSALYLVRDRWSTIQKISFDYLPRIAETMLMYAYIDSRGGELILTLLPPNREVSAPTGLLFVTHTYWYLSFPRAD